MPFQVVCHGAPPGPVPFPMAARTHHIPHTSPRLATPHLQGLGINWGLGCSTECKPPAWVQYRVLGLLPNLPQPGPPSPAGHWKVWRGNPVNAGEDTGEREAGASTARRAHSGKFAEMRGYVFQKSFRCCGLSCPPCAVPRLSDWVYES